MITMPNQIDFIPVVNIIPQPIYPAIYLPGIVHPFIQYNFVNYPHCGNFPTYNENYDQNSPQPQSLPPGLTSPEDDVFYFHDFFFSKDDPLLESYGDTISATGTFENMAKPPEKSIALSSLALSIMNSIWSDPNHSDAWEGFSIYKSGSIHHSQWRSILIETTQEQTNLISSEQMSKVIKKLLESSSQQSRFQKYCRNNSVHTILENYEEYQLWREIESILMEDQNELPFNIENVELGQVEIAEDENYQKQEQLVASEEQILIEPDGKNSLLSEKIQEKESFVVEEENAIYKVTKECFVQVDHLANTKENNKNGINRFRKSKRNTRKIKEIKNYANEIASSDSDQINKHKENKEIEEDQTRLKLQNPKEFEEDQGVVIENNANEENPQILETVENVKTKKARKNNRRKKANKKATANKFQSEDHPANVPDNILGASNIPNDRLSAHIEKLLALTLNQENENDFRYNMKGKMEDSLKDEEEKEFIAMKDYNTDFSKDFLKQTQNSTMTGETSAKTETDISTEYEECKKDGSTQKASKQNLHFNRTLKEDYEEQYIKQTDLIQSPRSASNIENEYYMDMISNILSEDPGALERLKEMLLSHSANIGLPGVGFTEEELQEIEEVNMELEKVMKRRFKDNQAEEDENPFLQQEEKPRHRPYGPEHDLVGLSNELVSLSALLCDDFDDIGPQKNLEMESNALGIPFETISYLEELMRNRAEFLGELQSGTKNA